MKYFTQIKTAVQSIFENWLFKKITIEFNFINNILNMLIKNVIVNNGIKEYNSDEIKSNQNILNLVNAGIILGGFSEIIDEINSENGLSYITCNIDFTSGKSELKNVPKELIEQWNKNKP